jgi:hypothetical protein
MANVTHRLPFSRERAAAQIQSVNTTNAGSFERVLTFRSESAFLTNQ